MSLPSPALLLLRNMNQYSSSLSTAAETAWSEEFNLNLLVCVEIVLFIPISI